MKNRRDFLKKAFLLAGMAGVEYTIPPAIKKALAIEPIPGSSFMDAEHVVILMQENRSFDHAFGTLQGVRGFGDPRFLSQRNGLPIWFQKDKQEKVYTPFNLGLKNTKSTWMGAVPHSRHDQVDAFNGGWHDAWIDAKRGKGDKATIPMTMGYYDRRDIPFNYALADAFTICDQNFCSVMSSTWPNRYYFWTGTLREQQTANAKAELRNELPFGAGTWETFPELLEDAGVPWKIYQNDLSCGGGFEGEERSWLANFSCNPLERFEKYNVKFSDRYVKSLEVQKQKLTKEIAQLEIKIRETSDNSQSKAKTERDLKKKKAVLQNAEKDLQKWSKENFDKLSKKEKNLYEKAFITNKADPDYRRLSTLSYTDNLGNKQELKVPKGDILYQFRQDVKKGKLPTVSWVVPAQRYSDHPSSPWYGSWYISEIIDILTENPEVWQKTIFILTYDENDGYFDHIPPFIPPHPDKTESGKCSEGIDTAIEYVSLEQELAEGRDKRTARGGAIGLGYRVPMIIASPWSKGGKVCSEVFDHTSTLQFLEKFLNNKFKTDVKVNQISEWRRTICGDLTSVFDDSQKSTELPDKLPFIKRNPYLEVIHKAKSKGLPKGFGPYATEDIEREGKAFSYKSLLPVQESGIRRSCILPYELYVDSRIENKKLILSLAADNKVFGEKGKGAPFTVYEDGAIRSYAVRAGDKLQDAFTISQPDNSDTKVYGPNGFYRCFKNVGLLPELSVKLEYEVEKNKFTGKCKFIFDNDSTKKYQLCIEDKAYGKEDIEIEIQPKTTKVKLIDLNESFCWYDFLITVEGYYNSIWHYAGRIEAGDLAYTDPQIGKNI